MSTGLPMLSTRVGFMEEIVIPEQTGLLAESGDLNGYAAALARLLGDDEARGAMGRRAGELVRARHCLDGMVRGFEELFTELLTPAPDLDRLRGPAGTRLCLLTSWPEQGEWRLLRDLRQRLNAVDVICPKAGGPKMPGRLIPGFQALKALRRAWRYNLIVSWSITQGVWLGLALRLLPRRKRPVHVCRDFHFDPTRTDWRYKLRLALLRLALPGIDKLWCTSRTECTLYGGMFGLSRTMLDFYPDEPPSELLERPLTEPGDYVLAYGNSDRDYPTLVRAARDIPGPVVVLTQAYDLPGPLPANLRVITDRLDNEALARLIEGSFAVVVPTAKFELAAGQNVMLEAMALARPVVATANLALLEYSSEGDAALYYEPGNDRELAAKAASLLADPAGARAMGLRGREAARRMLDGQCELFLKMISQDRQ
jgi:glycosyltransferase involved in cell wall biosynthesis